MLYFVANLNPKQEISEVTSYENAGFTEFGEVVEKTNYHKGSFLKKVGIGKEYPVNEFLVFEVIEGKYRVAFGCNRVAYPMNIILTTLERLLKEHTGVDYSLENIKEILSKGYESLIKNNKEIGPRFVPVEFGNEFFARDSHNDLALATRDEDCLLANTNFRQEIERINSRENKHVFLGNFVHYVLETSDQENAHTMINILVETLFANKRLISKRVLELKLEKYRDYQFGPIFDQIRGATLVINFTRDNEGLERLRKIHNYINRYAKDVLVIIVSDFDATTIDRFCKPLKLNLVRIEDGTEDRKEALRFLKNRVGQNKAIKNYYADFDDYLKKQNRYTYEDLVGAFNSYEASILAKYYYKSYQSVDLGVSGSQNDLSKEKCYEELDSIVGLKDVKGLIRRIVSLAKYNKKRECFVSSIGKKPSLHMCFKGNPGTAKTTMARLLGKILKAEGILSTGNFVECTRADLVGKYVGWTAPMVKRKFKEAIGGVLFIDEAYSLVEDRNGFATEAIDTIVSEMENHRDDVLVIFAGYPEKMEAFLEMNEGLRSRIPHHLTFPDYSENELLEILEVMAGEQGYKLTDNARLAVMEVFAIAKEQSDFGNGRYARNVLEEAIMCHVERVMDKEVLTEADMVYLDAADFDVALLNEHREYRRIGFAV